MLAVPVWCPHTDTSGSGKITSSNGECSNGRSFLEGKCRPIFWWMVPSAWLERWGSALVEVCVRWTRFYACPVAALTARKAIATRPLRRVNPLQRTLRWLVEIGFRGTPNTPPRSPRSQYTRGPSSEPCVTVTVNLAKQYNVRLCRHESLLSSLVVCAQPQRDQ